MRQRHARIQSRQPARAAVLTPERDAVTGTYRRTAGRHNKDRQQARPTPPRAALVVRSRWWIAVAAVVGVGLVVGGTLAAATRGDGRSAANGSASTVPAGSALVTTSAAPATSPLDSSVNGGTGALIMLPDPCSLFSNADVQTYLDGIHTNVFGYRNFVGPSAVQFVTGATPQCRWTFEQFLLSTGDLARIDSYFFVSVYGSDVYPNGRPCETILDQIDVVPLGGIGDCAAATSVGGGAVVVVGEVIGNFQIDGLVPETGATLLAVDTAMAERLAAALAA